MIRSIAIPVQLPITGLIILTSYSMSIMEVLTVYLLLFLWILEVRLSNIMARDTCVVGRDIDLVSIFKFTHMGTKSYSVYM